MTRKLIHTVLLASCSLGLLGQTSNTTALHIKRFVAPGYPALARKNRVQGITTSEVKVRADGTVESVRIMMAHPVFRDYVQKALKLWVFEPTGISTTLKVTVRFTLDDDCDKIPDESLAETRVQADFPDMVSVKTCTDPWTITYY